MRTRPIHCKREPLVSPQGITMNTEVYFLLHSLLMTVSRLWQVHPTLRMSAVNFRHVACMSSSSPVLNDETSVHCTYINRADTVSLQFLNGGHADRGGRAKVRTVFDPLNNGIVGSNPTEGMDVCPCLFCAYIVLCRQRSCGGPNCHPWNPTNCLYNS
jgi:hypothetical protein